VDGLSVLTKDLAVFPDKSFLGEFIRKQFIEIILLSLSRDGHGLSREDRLIAVSFEERIQLAEEKLF
jgi:hypothetical protein